MIHTEIYVCSKLHLYSYFYFTKLFEDIRQTRIRKRMDRDPETDSSSRLSNLPGLSHARSTIPQSVLRCNERWPRLVWNDVALDHGYTTLH